MIWIFLINIIAVLVIESLKTWYFASPFGLLSTISKYLNYSLIFFIVLFLWRLACY
jgi:hypothetical protein